MTLGEFRKLTEGMPDCAPVLVESRSMAGYDDARWLGGRMAAGPVFAGTIRRGRTADTGFAISAAASYQLISRPNSPSGHDQTRVSWPVPGVLLASLAAITSAVNPGEIVRLGITGGGWDAFGFCRLSNGNLGIASTSSSNLSLSGANARVVRYN